MKLSSAPRSSETLVTVGEQGQVYTLDMVNNALEWVENISEENSAYVQLDGKWRHADAGNENLWAVSLFNEVFKRNGLSLTEFVGTDWESVPGTMRFVSSAEVGVVWAIDPEDDVWILKTGDITTEVIINNIDHDWILVEGEDGNVLIQVDSGYNSQVVGVNSGGEAFWRTGITKATPMGSEWSNELNG